MPIRRVPHLALAALEPLEPRLALDATPAVAWSGPYTQIESSVVGDVNHDGLADAVFSSGHAIKLLINNGDGTFQAPVTTTIAGLVGRIALAHFDGDDTLDLVSVGYARQTATRQYLRVLMYDPAAGAFRITSRRPVRGTSLSAGAVTQLAVADILPNGRDDIALVVQSYAAFGTANVHVLSVIDGQIVNSGAGGGPSTLSPVRTLIGEVDSMAALALSPGGPAQLFFGIEHRSTTRAVAVSLSPRSGPWSVTPITAFARTGISAFAASDMDSDGRADILITTSPAVYLDVLHDPDSAVYLLPRPASGGPARRLIGEPLGFSSIPISMLGVALPILDTGDYDHDGFADLLLVHNRGGSGYVGGPNASFTMSQAELVVVSTNPSVPNRTLWSGYYRHDDPSNVTTGAPFPNFIAAGLVISGQTMPGLIGLKWGTPTELQIFATIPI